MTQSKGSFRPQAHPKGMGPMPDQDSCTCQSGREYDGSEFGPCEYCESLPVNDCECRGYDDLCACQNQPETVPMPHSQAAYTKQTPSYPGYINVTREGDAVIVTVRGDARDDGSEGPLATLRLTRPEWLAFHIDAGFRL